MITTISPDGTLYEEIGGRPALQAAVEVFYRRLLADPELAWLFTAGAGVRHQALVVSALGEALGGPERDRGPLLADVHRGLGITDAQFDRAAAHLSGALDEMGVPEQRWTQVLPASPAAPSHAGTQRLSGPRLRVHPLTAEQ